MLFNAALVTSITLGALVPSAQAATAAAPKDPTRIFDLSALDEAQRGLAQDVLDEFDFDWMQLRPALRWESGRRTIRVHIQDTSDWHALGLTWRSRGAIELDDGLVDPVWFQRVFRHELGHLVDFYFLTPKRLHDEVAALYGAPWKDMWHDFNDGFIQAASTFVAGSPAYPLSAQDLLEVRSLLGLDGTLPTKVP